MQRIRLRLRDRSCRAYPATRPAQPLPQAATLASPPRLRCAEAAEIVPAPPAAAGRKPCATHTETPQLKANMEIIRQGKRYNTYLGIGAKEPGREAAGFRAAEERRKAAATGREKERRRDAIAS